MEQAAGKMKSDWKGNRLKRQLFNLTHIITAVCIVSYIASHLLSFRNAMRANIKLDSRSTCIWKQVFFAMPFIRYQWTEITFRYVYWFEIMSQFSTATKLVFFSFSCCIQCTKIIKATAFQPPRNENRTWNISSGLSRQTFIQRGFYFCCKFGSVVRYCNEKWKYQISTSTIAVHVLWNRLKHHPMASAVAIYLHFHTIHSLVR